jgi:hypothetical protein
MNTDYMNKEDCFIVPVWRAQAKQKVTSPLLWHRSVFITMHIYIQISICSWAA